MNYVFVKRSDGSTVDIPEKDLQETLRRNPDWTVVKDEPEIEVPKVPMNQCPICFKSFGTPKGLATHKRFAHK